jgi:hypothetical protein
MHNSDFMREEAARYRELASCTQDVEIADEYMELAIVCDLVAIEIDELRASG